MAETEPRESASHSVSSLSSSVSVDSMQGPPASDDVGGGPQNVEENRLCYWLSLGVFTILCFLGYQIDNFTIATLFFFFSSFASDLGIGVIIGSALVAGVLLCCAAFVKVSWKAEIPTEPEEGDPVELADVVGRKKCCCCVPPLRRNIRAGESEP